jgi:hypothetical protein
MPASSTFRNGGSLTGTIQLDHENLVRSAQQPSDRERGCLRVRPISSKHLARAAGAVVEVQDHVMDAARANRDEEVEQGFATATEPEMNGLRRVIRIRVQMDVEASAQIAS